MINLIAAIGKNNELGLNGKLIWSLPSDLMFFKRQTDNKVIVMGRKTYQSLPKQLVNRKYVVLSKNNIDGVLTFSNIGECLKYLKNIDTESYIIGGAKIYELFLPYVDNMYLTHINKSFNADTFFPNFDKNNFKQEIIIDNKENNLEYKTIKYIRKR